MSIWSKSNELRDKWFLLGKGNLFCFAKGQTVQVEASSDEKDILDTILDRKCILDREGCPNLQCHTWMSLFEFLMELRLYKCLWRSESEERAAAAVFVESEEKSNK